MAHTRGDLFGLQMRSMAKILRTEQDINDVIAYINTLPAVQMDQLAQADIEGEL